MCRRDSNTEDSAPGCHVEGILSGGRTKFLRGSVGPSLGPGFACASRGGNTEDSAPGCHVEGILSGWRTKCLRGSGSTKYLAQTPLGLAHCQRYYRTKTLFHPVQTSDSQHAFGPAARRIELINSSCSLYLPQGTFVLFS